MAGIELIDGAGHWIQQEQPVRLSTLLLAFIKEEAGLITPAVRLGNVYHRS